MTNERKKVALFVCHDLVGLLMLNKIVPQIKQAGLEPVIFNTATNNNRKFKRPSPSIVSAFNVRVLEGVIIPFLEKSGATEGVNLTYRQLAKKHAIDYQDITDVNDADFVKSINDDPAFIGAASIRFLQVFGKPLIDVFSSRGFMWNLHSGLLPGYKGLLTPYRAIDNGEKEYGLTLHEMATDIDEGGIVAQEALPLKSGRPVLDLYLDTVDLAASMLTKALSTATEGHIPQGKPQTGAAAYYSNPTPEEFSNYMARGIFYADPELTVQRITNAFAKADTAQNKALKEEIRTFLDLKKSAAQGQKILQQA